MQVISLRVFESCCYQSSASRSTMSDPPPFSEEQLSWLRTAFGPSNSRASSQPPPQPDGSRSANERSESSKPYDIKTSNSSVTFRPYYSMPLEPSRLLSGTPLAPAQLTQFYSRNVLTHAWAIHPTGSLSNQAVDTLNQMPTFNPGSALSSGLALLAAAASAANRKTFSNPAPVPPFPSIGIPGPYNFAASLPPKVVKKILDLELVEMSELTIDDPPSQVPGRAPPPACLQITNIFHWMEQYALLAAVVSSRFPEKALELFAYAATIVRAERNYEGQRWVIYNRQHRREALARKDLNWSVSDSRLYNEAFTGRAKAIARCSFCLQDDHSDMYCPNNPIRSLQSLYPAIRTRSID